MSTHVGCQLADRLVATRPIFLEGLHHDPIQVAAEELAEDYSLPLESVLTFMLSIGVDAKRLRTNAPVKSFCTQQQSGELLAFLGSGNTMRTGPYKDNVKRAVKWLVEQQDDASGLIGSNASHDFIYGHAIATWALCEAYGLSKYKMINIINTTNFSMVAQEINI